ncbi:MAG: tRNA (N6-threonylcarbamoyladenosine(37)-N6)-methyltransferase TrmO [bacterium]
MEIQIIGHARTPWQRRQDAPHQPSARPDTPGSIEVEPQFNAALKDLESFNRIWLIFLFDRSQGYAPHVKPPRGGPKRGVLATRAPNRPSQLGLTAVELVRLDAEEGRLEVRGIDLLDQTPILDIKPYLPFTDAFPDAGHGWLEKFLDAGIEPRLKKPWQPPRS